MPGIRRYYKALVIKPCVGIDRQSMEENRAQKYTQIYMRHEYNKVEHFSIKKMALPFLGEKSHMENNKKRTWISLIPYVKIHFWCRDVLDLASTSWQEPVVHIFS